MPETTEGPARAASAMIHEPVRVDVPTPAPETPAEPAAKPEPAAATRGVTTSRGRSNPMTPHRILDATEQCLLALGYDGTTIRRIAKTLDCAVGTIYRHFTDKRELLSAVTQRRFDPVLEKLDAGGDPREAAAVYVDVARAQPELYGLMFWLASVGREGKATLLPDVVSQVIDRWAGLLNDPAAARSLWLSTHARVLMDLSAEDAPTPAPARSAAEREDVTLL